MAVLLTLPLLSCFNFLGKAVLWCCESSFQEAAFMLRQGEKMRLFPVPHCPFSSPTKGSFPPKIHTHAASSSLYQQVPGLLLAASSYSLGIRAAGKSKPALLYQREKKTQKQPCKLHRGKDLGFFSSSYEHQGSCLHGSLITQPFGNSNWKQHCH